MIPVDFLKSNTRIKSGSEDVGDLPAYVENGLYITFWRPDEEELKKLLQSGLVLFGIAWEPGQTGFPPITLQVSEKPFETHTS